MTDTMSRATRMLRGIAAFAAAAFVIGAASFFVPQRVATTVAVTLSFVGALALMLTPVLTVLMLTWSAKELPSSLRRLVTSQSILLLIFGALILWADFGRPASMSVAAVLLLLAIVTLMRVRGPAHAWVDGLASVPNFERATRVGVLAILLALSHSVMSKFQGFYSDRLEIAQLRAALHNVEDAQQTFLQDSGRFAASLDQLPLENDLTGTLDLTLTAGGYTVRAVGTNYGGVCELEVTRSPELANDYPEPADCRLGPNTNKPIIPEVPLFLLGAVLCGWLFRRPLAPIPKPAS